MTTLPDINIVREPRIVSGKYRSDETETAAIQQSLELVDQTTPTISKKDEESKRHKRRLYAKRQLSLETGLKATDIKGLFDQEELIEKSHNKLPYLIFNDKKRSTGYHRTMRSSDFENVRNAPIATRLIYNWKPLERVTTKTVQAKVKVWKPKKKIDSAARAPSPYKIQWSWETTEPNFHNEKRALEMKSIKYMQDHAKWSVYPYGNVDEKEEYNKTIRESLKEQINQKDISLKKDLEKKMLEYKFVSEQDRLAIEEDRRKKFEKFKYLSKFRDENKQIMEDRWIHEYLLKRHEWQRESELLQQDPINWSKTLK